MALIARIAGEGAPEQLKAFLRQEYDAVNRRNKKNGKRVLQGTALRAHQDEELRKAAAEWRQQQSTWLVSTSMPSPCNKRSQKQQDKGLQ